MSAKLFKYKTKIVEFLQSADEVLRTQRTQSDDWITRGSLKGLSVQLGLNIKSTIGYSGSWLLCKAMVKPENLFAKW